MAGSGGLAKLKLVMEIDGDKAVVTGLERVDNAVGRAGSSTTAATGRMAAGMNNVEAASGRMAAEHSRSSGTVVAGNGRMEQSFISLGSVIGSLSLAYLTKETIGYADAQTLIGSRIRLVVNSEAELAAVRKSLFDISQDTRTALSQTADLYSRVGRNSRDLALAQEDLLTITKAVNESIVISGGDAASAEAAIVQFGQALASGVLRGDELRSVMEQAPRLAEAIAVGMGKSIGELRTMGEAGALTAQAVVQALLSQSDAIDAEYGRIGMTVGQAMTTIDNAIGRYIGSTDRASSATATLASGIVWIGQHIDDVATVVVLVGGLIGTRFAVSLAIAARESAAKTATMAADWIKVMLAVEATTFKVGQFGEAVAVSNGAAAARTAALSGAITALGGPIGIITTLLGLGATAWTVWGTRAAEARDQAKRTTDDIIKDLERQTQALTQGSGFAAGEAEKRLADLQKEQQRLNEILAGGGIGEGAPIARQYVENAREIGRLTEVIKEFKAAVAATEAGPAQLGSAQLDAVAKVQQAITLLQADELQKRLLAVSKWEADQRRLLESAKLDETQIQAQMVSVHRAAEDEKARISAESADKEATAKKDSLERVDAEIAARQGDELQRRLAAEDAWAEGVRKTLEKAGVDEAQIQAEMVRVYQAAADRKTQITTEAAQKQAEVFDRLMNKIAAIDVGFAGVNSFGDPLSAPIGKAVEAMNRLNQTYEKQKELLTEIKNARDAALKEAGDDVAKRAAIIQAATTKEKSLSENSLSAQLTGYQELFGTTAQLFAENSKERQKMHNLEQAFAAVEIALQMRKAVVAAVTAVATQGSGDPYSAFARVAAMIALMAGVLGAAGIAFSGGGGASAAPAPTGSGTVLGDRTAVSESVDKTYQLLEDIHASEYRELVGIHRSVVELNNNITGLVANIVRNYGSFDSTDTSLGRIESLSRSLTDRAFAAIDRNPLTSTTNGLGRFDPLSALTTKYATEIANQVLGGVFGGKKSLAASGLAFGPTTVGDLLSGGQIDLSQFSTIKKSGGWFSDAKYSDQYAAVDPGIQQLFTNVFTSLGQTMQQLASGLGADVTEALNAYTIDLGKINLQGKTGEEINKALSGAISAAGDQMAEDLLGPIISQYQKLDEGLLETAVRLVAEQAVVLDDLSRSGQRATGDTVALSQALINLAGGLDNFRDAADTFYDKFFSAEEKQTYLHGRLVATLADMNLILPDTRAGYRALVDSLDLSNAADQQRYVQLLQLADAADQYYSALEEGSKTAFSTLKDQVSGAVDVAANAAAALKDILGSDLGNSSPESLYTQRLQAFTAAQAAGRSADLPELGKALLEASRAYNASGAGYQADFSMVTRALAAVAGMDGSSNPTLAAAEKQVQLLGDIRQAIEDSNGTLIQQLTEQSNVLRAMVWPLLSEIGFERTKSLPSYAVGTSAVPYDMTANIHQGEIIIDRASATVLRRYGIPASAGGDSSALVAEVRALRQEVAELKTHAAAGVKVNQAGFKQLLPLAERQADAQETVARKARLEGAA